MKILIACEYSGIIRNEFYKNGHDAVSCDIIDTEIPGKHIIDDVLNHLNENWDMMIGHPPCTYLSNAGSCYLFSGGIFNKKINQERYKLGLEGKEFFMKLYNANINKICIENPVPCKIFELPKYDQIIQPYEHGHPYQKRTCLWLKNLPKLKPTNILYKRESTKDAKWFNKCGTGDDRRRNRSKTFVGVAKAMAAQWG